MPSWSPGPVIGSGGYLGALGAGLLEMHFATVGSLILATSLILGGLLLSTDYALMQVAQLVLGTTVQRCFEQPLADARHARRPSAGQDDGSIGERSLSIRIGGVAMEEDGGVRRGI